MTNRPQADAVDERWVVRVYAAVLGVAGLLLAGWGPMWFGGDLPGQPWARAAILRMLGALIMVIACFGLALAGVQERRALRKALYWFMGAQVVSIGLVAAQLDAVWSQDDLVRGAKVMTGIFFLFAWFILTADGLYNVRPWRPQTLFGSQPEPELRSKYEEQIREAAAQQERHRLARELHDSIKQQIFVVQTAAATAQARFGADETGTREALDQVRSAAREAMAEMEALLDSLRAAPLVMAGLADALKQQCEALAIRTGAEVEFRPGALPQDAALPPGTAQAVYRVAQEALANAGRHARARRVEVALERIGAGLRLRVCDDGSGFDVNSAPRGMGLGNMRARAGEMEGTLELTSTPGRGTVVELRIPGVEDDADMMGWHLRMAAGGFVMVLVATLLTIRRPSAMHYAIAAIGAAAMIRSLWAWGKLKREGQRQ
ncbi:MAG: sensor histidine kinase [Acidobacteria bacterium]|nr:sensor histidine kinase [Acidobacteriota bacterium]